MKHLVTMKSNKFKVGDIVVCNNFIEFTDGTSHKKFQQIEVTEDTVAYFNVLSSYYDHRPSAADEWYYLYCNSSTPYSDGKTGFVADEKIVVNPSKSKILTTTELAFAKKFHSFNEASAFNATLPTFCIVFKRVDR